jgi:hypothetical protein
MFQSKNRSENLRHHVHMLRSSFIDSDFWSSHFGSEVKGLLDRQRREMHIVFGTVLHVTAIIFSDFLGCERVVVNLAFDRMILAALVGNRFQERGAA